MTKESLQRDRHALEEALKAAGAVFKGRAIVCCFHPDKHPSASIYTGEDGAFRFKCQAAACGFCGDIFDVIAKSTGKSVDDQLRDLSQAAPAGRPAPRVFPTIEALASWKGQIEAVYRYTNPDTRAVELIAIRVKTPDGKTFLQCQPNPGGGFLASAPPKPWPIYNRTRCRGAKSIVWVEGEKKVHLLTDLGFVACTTPAGSSNADSADYSPLDGVPEFIVWPDYDKPKANAAEGSGMIYARAVIAHLEALTPKPVIRIIEPGELGLEQDGSDVVDFVDEFGGDTIELKRASVAAALSTASTVGAADDLYQQVEDTISGKRRALAWPWRCISHYSKALMPGTVTILCGAPGASKSFMVLELASWMFEQTVPVALLELEEDRAYHLQRVLAQRAEIAGLTDPDWIRGNPDAVREAVDAQRAFIDAFAPVISTSPDHAMAYRDVVRWATERAQAGAKLIIIDPITAAESGEKPWIADLKVVTDLKNLARLHQIPIMLVTHPKKGSSGKYTLDDVAGGAAFQRFCQCILWLTRSDKDRNVTILDEAQQLRFATTINREIRLAKVRNGAGTKGRGIGFVFSSTSLKFEELGLIDKRTNDEIAADSAANVDVEDIL